MRATLRPWYHAVREVLLGDARVLAGGVALFALLATLPGLAAIVTMYGLVADPADIGPQLDGLRRVLPEEVVRFLIAQLERESARSTQHLGIAFATTLLLALYSARSTASALMAGLNSAYRVPETRAPLEKLWVSLAVASVTLVGCFVLAGVVVALPSALALAGLGDRMQGIAEWLRWPLLLVVITLALKTLYDHAPSPRGRAHTHRWPGAFVATALWLVISWALSLWVDRVADYEILYGTFASVLVLLLWFYASALVILLGGLVNAEMERMDDADQSPPAPSGGTQSSSGGPPTMSAST